MSYELNVIDGRYDVNPIIPVSSAQFAPVLNNLATILASPTYVSQAQAAQTATESVKNDVIALANGLFSDEIVNTYAEAVAFTPKTADMSFLVLVDEGTGGNNRRTLRVWDGSAFGAPSFIGRADEVLAYVNDTDNTPLQFRSTHTDSDVVHWKELYTRGVAKTQGGPGANESYHDHVLVRGFNVGASAGVQEFDDRAYLAEHYESKFSHGSGGPYGSEQFLTFIRPNDPTNENIRVRSYFLSHTLTPGASIRSDRVDRHVFFDFATGNEIMNWQLDNGSLFMVGRNVGGTVGAGTNNVRLYFDVNNAAINHQYNAAGNAWLSLPFFDNDNRIGLSGSGFKMVGSPPPGGNYGTDFFALQALSGAANGVLRRTYGPTVTGNYFIASESAVVSGELIDLLQNNSGSSVKQILANNATGDARIDFITESYAKTWRFGVDTSDGGALHFSLNGFIPTDPVIITRTGDLTIQGFMKFKPTTFASLGSATAAGAGATYFCTNLSGGAALVTSDGTSWRNQSGTVATAA